MSKSVSAFLRVLVLILLTPVLVSTAIGGQAKVDICHNDWDAGEYFVIRVSDSAVNAHLENHGDWLVSEEVCGDSQDNDCDGEVDEDCAAAAACPCLGSANFLEVDANLVLGFTDFWCDLYSLTFYDVEGVSLWIADGGWDAHGEAIDWADGTYSCSLEYNNGVSQSESLDISEEEYAACSSALMALAESYSVECVEFIPWW